MSNHSKSKDQGPRILVISEGDMMAQTMPDGTVRVGTVLTPAKANGRGKQVRPRIDWGTAVPLELVRHLAAEMIENGEVTPTT